ncbi:rhodanese-like domain-containing protein [Streptomyces sp. NPDC086080]|uniref:rhodanese-like domain-containing protein n=1 Tax=Streptomyces sp. NPDC086080 TaxID=3365748 RepID=UPI0037D02AE6
MFLFRRGPARITAAEAHRRVSAGEAVLIDVRERPEWDAGHAGDAVHLPLSRLTPDTPLPRKAAGRPLITICRSGNRSRRAAKVLAARGADVVDVRGGMTAWAAAGLPQRGRHRTTGRGR